MNSVSHFCERKNKVDRARKIGKIMQCQICNEAEATIHLTEITDGVRSEMHICERCATEQGIAVKSQIPINELLSSLLAVQPSDEELADPATQDLVCPNCGFSMEQFRKEGVLGCPHDYNVLETALMPLIEKAHDGGTKHCGKIPSNAPTDTKAQIELLEMQQQLEKAISNEDYELAAELRDKINKAHG